MGNRQSAEKGIFIGIPVIFIIGALMHFLYKLSGKNSFIGFIAPVNESVWEHLKMVPVPVMLWWTVYFLFFVKDKKVSKKSWFFGSIVSMLSAIVTIPLLYYFYTEAFGIHLVLVDILIFFLSVTAGQILGCIVYKKNITPNLQGTISIFIAILVLFGFLTVHPPHIPLFQDHSTGQYGVETYK